MWEKCAIIPQGEPSKQLPHDNQEAGQHSRGISQESEGKSQVWNLCSTFLLFLLEHVVKLYNLKISEKFFCKIQVQVHVIFACFASRCWPSLVLAQSSFQPVTIFLWPFLFHRFKVIVKFRAALEATCRTLSSRRPGGGRGKREADLLFSRDVLFTILEENINELQNVRFFFNF